MKQDKYVVIKREDWDMVLMEEAQKGLTPEIGHVLNELASVILPDAHVFRDQDLFAPTVLFAYAHAIRNTVEIMSRMGAAVSADEMERLNNMADDFMDAAEKASAAQYRKLPD